VEITYSGKSTILEDPKKKYKALKIKGEENMKKIIVTLIALVLLAGMASAADSANTTKSNDMNITIEEEKSVIEKINREFNLNHNITISENNENAQFITGMLAVFSGGENIKLSYALTKFSLDIYYAFYRENDISKFDTIKFKEAINSIQGGIMLNLLNPDENDFGDKEAMKKAYEQISARKMSEKEIKWILKVNNVILDRYIRG